MHNEFFYGPSPKKFKLESIKKSADFRRLKKNVFKIGSSHFLLCFTNNALLSPRLGIIVTKKIGNSVKRNLIKRRIRACARTVLKRYSNIGFDVLAVARPDSSFCKFEDMLYNFDNSIKRYLENCNTTESLAYEQQHKPQQN